MKYIRRRTKRDEIRKNIEETQNKYKERYDKHRHKNVKFNVDIVGYCVYEAKPDSNRTFYKASSDFRWAAGNY